MKWEIEDRIRRPLPLTIFCSLSFAGSMAGIVITLALIFNGAFAGFFSSLPLIDTIMADASAGNLLHNLVKLVLLGASFYGVLLMCRMRKKGYWVYTAAQLLLLIVPIVFLRELGNTYLVIRLVVNLIFSLLFVLIYTAYYRRFV